MMKKRMLALLVIVSVVLSMLGTFAAAEGKLSIVQKNFYIMDGSLTTSHLFAKIENVGDMPATLGNGQMVVFDLEDNIIGSDSYVSIYPKYLLPGESAYAIDWGILDKGSSAFGDYKFSVVDYQFSSSDDHTKKIIRLANTVKYDCGNTTSAYDDYVEVTFANTTETTLYDIGVVFAITDKDNQILFADSSSLYHIGVHPGSTMTYRLSIDSDFTAKIQQAGDIQIDAIVYAEND